MSRFPVFDFGPRFDSIHLLECGSQGEVYRAHDLEFDIPVALKRLGEVSADSVVRLKAEFRAAAALSHPNLVTLHELFVETATAYFSMELVDGVDFLAALGFHIRVDPERLADLAHQLCSGVAALHEVGLVHRDIKPKNILVRTDGRLVLLDYGFMRDGRAVPASPQSPEGLVGTLAYMAPEQLSGAVVGPAADVYAVGAVLHEALTGAPPPPWLGGSAELATTACLSGDVPPRLRPLINAMLSVRADRRPTMAEACAALEDDPNPIRPVPPTDPPFVGRTEERRRLMDAILELEAGSLVEILGASGVGKSEMVRHVLSDLDSQDAVVLRSRCRRSESVPFQALDAAIDDLGVELLRRRGERPDAAVDVDARTSSVLFPSLARLPNVERPNPDAIGDPIERRREAVAALRRLLVVASTDRRLVVWIDDAQWADADSIVLLTDLLALANPPAVHWILTTRTGTGQTTPLAESIASSLKNSHTFRREAIDLAPLDDEDSAALVRSLAGDRLLSDEAIREIVRAGAGFPFVLAGMAALDAGTSEASMPGGFASVLARSIVDLTRDEHRMLELVALSRQPTELDLLLEAAEVGNSGVLSIRKLESRRLIRTAPRNESVVVDSYHDQVPDTLLASLGEEQSRDGHGRLARAHQKRSSDPAILSHHFHGAGEMPTAASYAELAGRQADAALAFARAAEFYRSARVWHDRADPQRLSKLLQLEGGALANAGALASAGERYLLASSHAAGLDALELRRRAVESLLAGGRVDEALQELRSLLNALGLTYPRTESAALLKAVGSLFSYLVRSRACRRPAEDPMEMLRGDTCYSAGRRLADIDPSRGTYFLAASLSRTARAGDPARFARSLCTAGGALGAVAGATINRIGDRMMREASRISDSLGNEELAGMIDVAYGEIHMLAGRWREALVRSRSGVRRLLEKPGFVFECNAGRGVILRALEELGEIREEYAEGRALLESAVAHHNTYAELRAVQHLCVVCVPIGRTAEARSYLGVGFDRWVEGAFHIQHASAARNEALCDLYDRDPEHALSVLDSIDGAFRRSVLRHIALLRVDLCSVRGQVALALACKRDRQCNLSMAARAAATLEREKRPDADVRAALLRAGIESWSDIARACRLLEIAEGKAEAAGMRLHALCAAYVRSGWSGDCGQVDRRHAELAAIGVGDPRRYAAVCVPGRHD